METLMSRSLGKIAANIATIFFAVVIVLQLLLAVGILPASMAWGGRQPELTPGLQMASIVAAFILALFAYVIRRRAGLVGTTAPSRWIKIASWLITGFMVLNTVGNITSLSAGERMLFTPVTIILAVSCFMVSISKTE